MPTYYARANGNVNAAIWATTPTGTASNLFSSFTNADTLMANGFSVTLNVSTTVLEIRNDTTGGATNGGSFTLSANGVTLTANVLAGSQGTVLNIGVASPDVCAIVGTITGGTSGSVPNGSVFSGSGTLNITGNVAGGTASVGLQVATGTVNITGNVSGPSTGTGIAHNSGSLTITGTVTGCVATGFGVISSGSGPLTVVGTAVGGVGTAGVNVTGSGTVTITRARGNGFGNGSAGLSAAVGVATSQNSNCRVSEFEYGDLGQSPTSGPIILTDSTANVALFYRLSGGKKTLTDPAATADFPANSNVRSGTVFANGNRTGTCAVPAAGSVALGVPVDNTTGTAVLTPAAVWSFATSSATTSGSMGERLANAATVASTGQQLANALTP